MTDSGLIAASPYFQLAWFVGVIIVTLIIYRRSGGVLVPMLFAAVMFSGLTLVNYGVISIQSWVPVLWGGRMTDWDQVVGSPYLQLMWIVGVTVVTMILSRLNGGLVLGMLFSVGMFWMVVVTGYGVISTQPWMYVVHAGFAALLLFAFMICVSRIIEKYGTRNYNEEGMIVLLGVPYIYLGTLLFSLPIKGGLELIHWLST